MSPRASGLAAAPRTKAWLDDQLLILTKAGSEGDDSIAGERVGLKRAAMFAAKLEQEMKSEKMEVLRLIRDIVAACDVQAEPRQMLESRIRRLITPLAAHTLLSAIVGNRVQKARAGKPTRKIG